mgnify:CR=1 FL=1
MKNILSITYIVLRLFLGGMMIYGGWGKFEKPNPTALKVVEKAKKFTSPEQESTLQKVLYINGAKQTGYFWELLGICELVFGLLLIIQGTSFIGAVLLLPITLHIFLFHAFLELDEIGELIMTGGLLLANLILVFKEYSNWKHLIWIKVF